MKKYYKEYANMSTDDKKEVQRISCCSDQIIEFCFIRQSELEYEPRIEDIIHSIQKVVSKNNFNKIAEKRNLLAEDFSFFCGYSNSDAVKAANNVIIYEGL